MQKSCATFAERHVAPPERIVPLMKRHVAPAAFQISALGFAVFAAFAMPAMAAHATDEQSTQIEEDSAPILLRWVPDWLIDSVNAAIADATDTRDRHAAAKP